MVAITTEVLRIGDVRDASPSLLVNSSLQRDSLLRFSREEKWNVALDMRRAWNDSRERRIGAPYLNYSEAVIRQTFPDGEPQALRKSTDDKLEHIRQAGRLTILANLETPNDVLALRTFLRHLGNPETTLASPYFPLERGDRPEPRQGGVEMVMLETLVDDLAKSNVKYIFRAETHSPVFSYLALRAGMAVVDFTPLPSMFSAALGAGLFQEAPIVVVTGDAGASEMGLLVNDLAKVHGIQTVDPVAGEKVKSNGQTTVSFRNEDLNRIAGYIAVIPEDILATGGTLNMVYWQLSAAGVKSQAILVTYPIVAGNALENLADKKDLTVVTTDGRKPLQDISKAGNFVPVPVMAQFANLIGLDNEGVDFWSEDGTTRLLELGFCLAPWLTYNQPSPT